MPEGHNKERVTMQFESKRSKEKQRVTYLTRLCEWLTQQGQKGMIK